MSQLILCAKLEGSYEGSNINAAGLIKSADAAIATAVAAYSPHLFMTAIKIGAVVTGEK
jgi:hypothetical protein